MSFGSRHDGWMETERLSMRPLSDTDATLFCELYGDPETMRFIGPPLSRERALRGFRIILASQDSRPLKYLFLVIVEKLTRQAIGIGALQQFDTQRRRVEAGVVLNSMSRGRGFGREGLRGLVTYAFAGFPLDEVWVQHAVENAIFGRLSLGLGFSRRLDGSAYGVGSQNCVWSIYREDW
jgi:RimJ/RimL family protein N-acetyltransferase